MTKIDLEQLDKELQVLKRHQPLYRIIRDRLKELGHWRYLKRGDPKKGFKLKGKKG